MPAHCLLLGLAFFFPVTSVQAAPTRGMQLEDIAKIRRIGAPAISLDGQWVAYSVTTTDMQADAHVTHVWLAKWDGTAQRQVTAGAQTGNLPRWRPRSDSLSFLAKGAGSYEGPQVWLIERDGGEARQITHVHQAIEEYAWSPDGARLLLNLQDRTEHPMLQQKAQPEPIVITRYQFKADGEGYLTDQRNHLYLFNVATSQLTRLLHEKDEDEEGSGTWSPDGQAIAFVSQRAQATADRTEDADLFVVASVADGVPRQLTQSDRVMEGPLEWSPDGQMIAFREATNTGYSSYTELQLAVVPVQSGTVRALTEKIDRPAGAPVFEGDGKTLLTTIVDDGNVYAERVRMDGGSPLRLTKDAGVVTGMTARAGHTVVEWSTDTTLPELYALEADGSLRKLTHQNDALLAMVRLEAAREISAKASDGKEVHGLLTFPVRAAVAAKVPMVVWIHGGPTGQDAHGFDLSRQLFAAHGYAVLQVNYRGSSGRGFAFSRDIEADWGNKEVSDLLAVVDAAIATGRIDADRLVVGGWSYGGILTDDLIATTNRFKAASAGAGRANLIGIYGVNAWVLQYDSELGQPWKNPEQYIKLSYAFFHADRIKTPTLFMGGDRDFNVPISGSEQMYEALRSAGTPAELIVYPGEFHGFSRPSFIVDRYRRWFQWYDQHLGVSSER